MARLIYENLKEEFKICFYHGDDLQMEENDDGDMVSH